MHANTTTPAVRALVALALPAVLLAGCGVDVRATVGTPTPSATEGVDGDALGMCAPGVPDCVDVVVDPDGEVDGDAIVAEDVFISDILPPDARFVGMSHDPAAEAWPVFLQQAVVRDGRVDLLFSGGEAPCFVVDHVETDESDEAVIVSVFVRSAAEDQFDCADQEVSTQGVTVELQAPLGERPLLDGSRTVRPG